MHETNRTVDNYTLVPSHSLKTTELRFATSSREAAELSAEEMIKFGNELLPPVPILAKIAAIFITIVIILNSVFFMEGFVCSIIRLMWILITFWMYGPENNYLENVIENERRTKYLTP